MPKKAKRSSRKSSAKKSPKRKRATKTATKKTAPKRSKKLSTRKRTRAYSGGKDPASLLGADVQAYEESHGKAQPHDYAEFVQHDKGWVYGATRVIAEGCAAQGLTFYKRTSRRREDWKPLPDAHPLYGLFLQPNPFRTYMEFIEETVKFLCICGNAYWLKVGGAKTGKRVGLKELWLMPSQDMRVIPDRKDFIKGYGYKPQTTAGKFAQEFEVADIVHLRVASTQDKYYGVGRMAAATDTINADEYLAKALYYVYANAPHPSKLMVDKKRKGISRTQRKEIETLLQRHIASKKAGRVMYMCGDLDLQDTGASPQAMDFLNSSNVTMKRIMGIFGVGPAPMGLLENASRANMEAGLWALAKFTLEPMLRRLADKITADIVRKEYGLEDVVAEFDSPVPGDRKEDRQDWILAVKNALASPDEARHGWLDLDDLPERVDTPGQTPWMDQNRTNMLPIGDEEEQPPVPPVPPPPEGKPEEGPQGEPEEPPVPEEPATPEEGEKVIVPSVRQLEGKTAAELSDILVDLEAEGIVVDELVRGEIERLIRAGALQELATLGLSSDDIKMDAKPFVDAFNERRAAHWAKTIIGVSHDDLARVIGEGIQEGLSARELAARIQEHVGVNAARAERIARTEVIGSMNAGAQGVLEEAGIEKKEWLATQDDRVRETHAAADGQIRATGKKFRVGAAWLRHPGDPLGPPNETVNCRCAIAGHVEERSAEARVQLWKERDNSYEVNTPPLQELFRQYLDDFWGRMSTVFSQEFVED